MLDTLAIANIAFRHARLEDRSRGLFGYVSLDVGNALRLDGLAVRRKLNGGLTLSYPERRQHDRTHPIIKPLDDDARREFEEQVIGDLRRQGHLP